MIYTEYEKDVLVGSALIQLSENSIKNGYDYNEVCRIHNEIKRIVNGTD